MNRDKQISEIAKIILNVDRSYYGMECDEIQAKAEANAIYADGYRKSTDVARNIFGNLRILGYIDFDGNFCIRKDSFEELEKHYTEENL